MYTHPPCHSPNYGARLYVMDHSPGPASWAKWPVLAVPSYSPIHRHGTIIRVNQSSRRQRMVAWPLHLYFWVTNIQRRKCIAVPWLGFGFWYWLNIGALAFHRKRQWLQGHRCPSPVTILAGSCHYGSRLLIPGTRWEPDSLAGWPSSYDISNSISGS